MRLLYRTSTSFERLACLLAAAVLAGCASTPAPFDAPAHSAQPCVEHAAAWDRAVTEAGVVDAQHARVPGFSYLRVDRFLAAHPAAGEGAPGAAAWVQALRALDREARGIELANLPAPARTALAAAAGGDPAAVSERCGARQVQGVLADSGRLARVRRVATVPDSYIPVARVLGLYPITSVPVLAGVDRLHADFRDTFATPLQELPVRGRLQRYAPALVSAASPAAPGAGWPRDALGMTRPDDETLAALFAAHAPEWEIDVVGDDDRIGTPRWTARGPSVDVTAPVVYQHHSHTWFEGEALLQLSYVVWFPSRPPAFVGDPFAGRLDGLTWRVTLDRDGRPLLYDVMHNCGCYHLFLSTPRLARAAPARRYEEPPLVVQQVPDGGGGLVLRLASRTHHLLRAYRDPGPSRGVARAVEDYAMEDYDALRSLPTTDGGRRSLFAADGLVPESARSERFFLWPMGVPSAGAMRQWGRHATAFVGVRHFDDADLVGRYFVRSR